MAERQLVAEVDADHGIAQGYRFDAFLSYSHAADGRLAPALRNGLHRFAKPLFELRVLRVFRDETSLSANPALWPSIEAALTESRFFILMSSRVWDVRTGTELAVLRGHENGLWDAVISPDGTRVVTASGDGTARLWDLPKRKEKAVLRGHMDAVVTAAISADGSKVVTASEDNTARLWDLNTGKILAVLRGHEHWLYAAAFSPDGTRIVTVSDDFTARLWDANTGKELAVLHGHESPVVSAAFSPDDNKIVTTSWDKTARIWDVPRSKQELIDLARQRVQRSLTSDERRRFFLSADQAAQGGY